VSADRGPILLVLLSRLANFGEVLLRTQHGAAEPNGVPLHNILGNLALDFGLFSAVRQLCVLNSGEGVQALLQLLLQTLVETLEQS